MTLTALIATPYATDFQLTATERDNERKRHFSTSSENRPPAANVHYWLHDTEYKLTAEDRLFATLGGDFEIAWERAEGGYPIHEFCGMVAWEITGDLVNATPEELDALNEKLLADWVEENQNRYSDIERFYIRLTLKQPWKNLPYFGYC